jgi:predicted nucleic acid-binding protein
MAATAYEDAVFLDESALKSLMDNENEDYARARTFFLDLDDLERVFVSTSYVIFDTHEWLRDNYGYTHAEFFLNTIEKAMNNGKLSLISGNEQLEQEAKSLLQQCPQLQFSLGEAVTAVVMLTYRITRIFAFNPAYLALLQLNKEIKVIPTA